MKRRVAALAAVVLLSACGATESPAPGPDPVESQVVEGEGLVKPWGSEVEVGPFALTVERPEERYTSKSSDIPDGSKAYLLDMKATNNGDAPVPAYNLYVKGFSGGVDVVAFQGFVGEGFGAPSADLLPGQTVEWQQPIAVADIDDVTLQIDFGRGTLNIEDSVYIGDAAE